MRFLPTVSALKSLAPLNWPALLASLTIRVLLSWSPDANLTWCGDYPRQLLPDGHLCKWDPTGAPFSLLNILGSSDKLAAGWERQRSIIVSSASHEWLMVWANTLSYGAFATSHIHHDAFPGGRAGRSLSYSLSRRKSVQRKRKVKDPLFWKLNCVPCSQHFVNPAVLQLQL